MKASSFAPRFVTPILALLFALALLNSNGYGQGDTLVDVFPLSIGNQWTYRYFALTVNWPAGNPIETRTDSGRVTYNVLSNATNTDSTRWQFRLTRDLIRHRIIYYPVDRDTSFPIRDTSLFDLIENQQGQHQLYRNENPNAIHLDVFPFTRDFTDTTRMYRFRSVGQGDTASFKSRRAIVGSGARSTFTVKRATGLLRFRYNSGTYDVFDSAYHYLLSSVITSLNSGWGNQPERYSLSQNYPNPFNPETKIGFRIRETGFVSLKVFDVLGREVATLLNEVKEPGGHSVPWNPGNLSSGVYYYQLRAGENVATKKMLLMR